MVLEKRAVEGLLEVQGFTLEEKQLRKQDVNIYRGECVAFRRAQTMAEIWFTRKCRLNLIRVVRIGLFRDVL